MKTVNFYPSSRLAELVVPPPKPASEYIPEWYKDMKIFGGNEPKFENGILYNATVKSCMPFFDAYSSGYIQETWTDIHFSFDKDNNTFQYNCASNPLPISHRETPSINISKSFRPHEFNWQFHWMPKLEDGYSMLITQPFNRMDLPFMNTTGIVDSDTFFHTIPGNYPFYVYDNFQGIIPKGTPMFQMIPIKRDSWKSSVEVFNEDDHTKRSVLARSLFIGGYRRMFHKKKVYK
jgi:hypothetical protein